MSTTYSYRPNDNMVTIFVRGPSSLAECDVCVTELLADASIPHGVTVLIDVTGAQDVPPAHEAPGLSGLIARMAEKGVPRVATLVARVGHSSIATLIAAMVPSARLESRAFLARDEALRWLASASGDGAPAPAAMD